MSIPTPTGFAYRRTEYRYVALYRDGSWQPGGLTTDETVTLNESACVLQYAQTCFEGLKAFRTEDGHIVCFRPDLNEARLHDSCIRMRIPPLPAGMFEDAVRQVVLANRDAIPDAESGGSLYLRPFVFGTNPVLGVKPASEFQFRLFASPVGSYFAGGARPLRLRITDFDRAAPHGTGHIKAGLNYAMSLFAIADAHEKGTMRISIWMQPRAPLLRRPAVPTSFSSPGTEKWSRRTRTAFCPPSPAARSCMSGSIIWA